MAAQIDYNNYTNRFLDDIVQCVNTAERDISEFGLIHLYGPVLPGDREGVERLESLRESFVQNIDISKIDYNSLADSALKVSNVHLMTKIEKLTSYLPKMDSIIAALKAPAANPKDKGDSKEATN